jgi:hypothetical protein
MRMARNASTYVPAKSGDWEDGDLLGDRCGLELYFLGGTASVVSLTSITTSLLVSDGSLGSCMGVCSVPLYIQRVALARFQRGMAIWLPPRLVPGLHNRRIEHLLFSFAEGKVQRQNDSHKQSESGAVVE